MKRLMKKLFHPLKKKAADKNGFTLLEILVVLTIMGFLIAMVAPRLAGISSSAVDTVCDTNQNRTITMVAAYFEQTGKFPNKLTNLVVQEGRDTITDYYTPSVSDDDPDNGQETLASEFYDRVHPRIHILNQNEVDELAEMGITKVFNLNSYDNFTVDASDTDQSLHTGGTTNIAEEGSPMQETTLEEGVGVMMSGMGYDGTAFVNDDADSAMEDLIGYGEADFLGRIVFGFGPENGMITSGLITNAAHCPGGIQNSDNVIYNDYNLIVPRLQATVDRVETATAITDVASSPNDVQYAAYGYTEDFSTTGTVGSTVDAITGEHTAVDTDLKARTLTFGAQELYQYATMCPEGHMYPADDSDFWAVDLGTPDGSVTINE